MRTIVDIVPNHVSDQHPWFRDALASEPGSPERERFWFRPGIGPDGAAPPNGWQSIFGGSAWTRADEAGEWYLHLFAPEQPDLNWTHPDVLGRARGRPPVLVRPRRRRRPHRLGGAARKAPRPRRADRRQCGPASTRSPTGTSSTTSTAGGARSPTAMRSRASSSARSGCPIRCVSPDISDPTSCTPRSTSTFSPARGTARGCARRSSRHSPRTPPSTRRRPGCCRTTT